MGYSAGATQPVLQISQYEDTGLPKPWLHVPAIRCSGSGDGHISAHPVWPVSMDAEPGAHLDVDVPLVMLACDAGWDMSGSGRTPCSTPCGIHGARQRPHCNPTKHCSRPAIFSG